MFNIIPITPATIEIITKLNDGVEPVLESMETFFVYRGENEPSAIIDREELMTSDEYPKWMTVVEIYYRG